MPDTTITAVQDWAVTEDQVTPGDSAPNGALTLALGEEFLPATLAGVLKEVTGSDTSPGTVVVGWPPSPVKVSANHADIWIRIYLFASEARLAHQKKIRDRMLQATNHWLCNQKQRLGLNNEDMPTVDVDVYIAHGGGGNIDRDGTVSTWGCNS